MTSLSENTVVTTSGGLVELGYGQITSTVVVSSTSFTTPTTIIPDVTVVCDGSPIMVEFYAPQTAIGAGQSQIVFALWEDGAEKHRYWHLKTNPSGSTGTDYDGVKAEIRLTPSAGTHTYRVVGISSPANNSVLAGSATTSNSPAFLRVSKIVQASQFIVPLASAPLVTSLPSAPIDGQEIRYVADATNGIIWNLRYRAASSSAYKWEFIGGSPLHNSNGSYPGAINSASYVDVPSAANVTVPLDGDYMVDFNGKADCTSSQYGSLNNVAVMTATVSPSDTKAAGVATYTTSGGYVRGSFSRLVNLDGVSAGETIKMQARAAVGSVSIVYHYTGMSVTPIRVG